jgi:hypothetical protein
MSKMMEGLTSTGVCILGSVLACSIVVHNWSQVRLVSTVRAQGEARTGKRVATVSAVLTVGSSHAGEGTACWKSSIPCGKGLVKRPEDGWRSIYNNLALDKVRVAACPIQIDYVRLSLGYRA